MPIAYPEKQPEEQPDRDSTRPSEHERTRPRAREGTGDSANVVSLRGENLPVPRRPVAPPVLQVWWNEASETATRAVDGSVWRSRAPALRDSHERLKRAEWAGGLPLLRWAGWVYGYPALAVRAVLLAVSWLLDHPSRLAIAAALALLACGGLGVGPLAGLKF